MSDHGSPRLAHALLISLALASWNPASAASREPSPNPISSTSQGWRTSADVRPRAGGLLIHGSVCRDGGHPAASARRVRVERLSPEGAALSYAEANLSHPLNGRQPGCAYFDLTAPWTLTGDETLRFSPG